MPAKNVFPSWVPRKAQLSAWGLKEQVSLPIWWMRFFSHFLRNGNYSPSSVVRSSVSGGAVTFPHLTVLLQFSLLAGHDEILRIWVLNIH